MEKMDAISPEETDKMDGSKIGETEIHEPPTFSNFMDLLSSDQRRIAMTVLLKAGLLKMADKILTEESAEAREYFLKLRAFEEGNGPVTETDTDNNSSQTDSFDDSSEDEEDPDEDPAKWTPKVKDDFFEKFPDTMNILILGETGVGKSTFINGLANYLRFGNIYEAKDHFEILIKTYFTHSDGEFNGQRIECDPTIVQENADDNENVEDGQSSTQAPKSYLISWGPPGRTKRIRIIDTPGVGDVRGLEQEKKNYSKILDFIAQYKELHAICILMKPNESKLTLTFRYCLNELLTHLHASASRNILFCITNARQTFYQPGETRPTLQAYLTQLQKYKNVEIPLDSSTMFCFDNESFRCLCAWREGVNFTKDEIADFNRSWKTTVKETFRLFKRISELPVHNVADTVSVNNIRSVILTMAKPMAEISRSQMMNLQLIDRKIKEIEDCIREGEDLTGKLYVDQIELVPQEISQPETVCASTKCIEYKKVGSGPDAQTQICYSTVCHRPCALEGIQTEFCPNPAIKSCYVFHTPDNLCKKCGCSWECHIHIRYKLDKVIKKIVDPAVAQCLQDCADHQEAARLFIKTEKERRVKLEKEAAMISSHCVEFAAFLKENSLIPYNDVYKEYVNHLIKEAKSTAEVDGCFELLQVLEANKDAYDAQIEVIEKQKLTAKTTKTVEEINLMVNNLKKLEDCGTVLQEVQKLELISLEKQQNEEPVAIKIKGGWFDKKFNSLMDGAASVMKGAKKAAKSFFSIGGMFKKKEKAM